MLAWVMAPSGWAQAPAGEVTGVGNFAHIVTNLDRSIAFYQGALGLTLRFPARPFDPNPAVMKMGNTLGAQSRIAVLTVPGAAIGVELIEYKDIDRRPAHPRFQDPGAGNLALRVRDLNAILPKVKQAGGRILTVSGEPAEINGNGRIVFVQDPDGFICELAQAAAPPANSQASQNVFGGSFELAVDHMEQTRAFYRLLGMQPSAPAAWNGSPVMTDTAGTPGAQFRQSRATIPGTSTVITFIEFKDIGRKPLHTRVQDPGTALLQLTVRDVSALLPKLKAGGGTIISVGAEAAVVPNVGKIAIVRDPNNLFLELVQREAGPK